MGTRRGKFLFSFLLYLFASVSCLQKLSYWFPSGCLLDFCPVGTSTTNYEEIGSNLHVVMKESLVRTLVLKAILKFTQILTQVGLKCCC